MGTPGTGTSTQFTGRGGISITDENGIVVITDNQDAVSIQGVDIEGTTPPVGTTPQLLEYDPSAGEFRYVDFPTGHATANNSTISIVPGDHLTVGSNQQSPSDQPVRFTTNQAVDETITVDLRTINTDAEFTLPLTDDNRTALVEAHVLRTAIDRAAAPSGTCLLYTSPSPRDS